MPKNVNRNTPPGFDALTPTQAAAVGHLLAGKSGKDTAGLVGVSEETVSRWRNGSPSFAAAMNVGRAELHNEQLDTLRQLRRKALDALTGLLEADDTAVKLKAVGLVLGLDVGAPVGPQTPEQQELEWSESRQVDLLEVIRAGEYGRPGTVILPYAPQAPEAE